MAFSQELFARRYAVAIIRQRQIVSVPQRHLSIREAVAYARSYNIPADDLVAVVMRHPISRAMATAKAKSRSS
jgi:hypothetical protein